MIDMRRMIVVVAFFAGCSAPQNADEKSSAASKDQEKQVVEPRDQFMGQPEEPVADEVRNGRGIVDRAMNGPTTAWQLMDELCTDIGPRLSGSENLDRALQWAKVHMEKQGHENVRIEPVKVPAWHRGNESAVMTAPYDTNLAMLGLGMSVGTPPKGIEAEVVVLSSKEELEQRKGELAGKIVLWNVPMVPNPQTGDPGYGDAVGYRVKGADMVAKHGAVAMLIRSLASATLYTPHTGTLSYDDRSRAIPAAAITVEDADRIARLTKRGKTVKVRLKMDAKLNGEVDSGNVIGEIVGAEKPEEIVVIGGHIDSWDVGEGAHDNASGVAISMAALDLLREAFPRPRRTIRVVLWTNEENGLGGARAYARDHEAELSNHVAAVESDSGGARVVAIGLQSKEEAVALTATERFEPVAPVFTELAVTSIGPGRSGADLGPLVEKGVLGIGLRHDVTHYFDVHHTAADTLDKIDPDEIRQGVASMALLAWWLANSPERIDGR